MRLLHLAKYAPPERGGMETFVRDLTVEQARQGQVVTVLCHQSRPLRPSAAERLDGVEIIRCATLCAAAFAPLSPAFGLRLRSVIRRQRPDIIHIHLPNPAVMFLGLIPRDIPLVAHWHADVQGSSSPTVRALYPAYRLFEQRCLARADRIVATSPPYLESSPTLAPWRSRCAVVPLGLDTGRYPEEDTDRPPRPLVLGVGRLTFYKGFEFLVRAAALVPEADFVIAGHGPEQRALETEIRRLDLEGRVSLPGEIADAELRRLLQAASLFCLPSIDRGEAFGVTLLEAMRYGLPLVSTAIPGSGTGWVNRDRETGRVANPADAESLARAIRDVLADPDTAGRYGEGARKRLEDAFTIDRTARTLDGIYREITKG
ncbi:glycosyltransferase [Pseudodesulfovibrio portus]|uniref:Mannosyltransferase n=1 Tax=Pseudodesulfovibrio portus TaxID=231439 RepID=A0ABM8ASC9_9BACT|nr:glycosyltransferase [Pseudodesulfovibrio portus]BDQ34349.1 mannosyltransferase [Pseudodesulfovibrio portus]